jgi:hypothetical protein
LSYFSDRVSGFLPRLVSHHDPLSYSSYVVEITGMHHYSASLFRNGSLQLFTSADTELRCS